MKTARIVTGGILLILAPIILAERTKLKPGFNLFSPAQDVEIGQRVSKDADRQLKLINQEIAKLGGARNFKNDSADFQRIKRVLKSK